VTVYEFIKTGPECWDHHGLYATKELAVAAMNSFADKTNAKTVEMNDWTRRDAKEEGREVSHFEIQPFYVPGRDDTWLKRDGFYSLRIIERNVAGARQDPRPHVYRIQAERDRYREALEEIASAPDPVGRLVPSGFLTLRKIARDALPPEVES